MRQRKTKILGICKRCNRERIIIAKGCCNSCYSRHASPMIICKICGKTKHHHGKGMCQNCYQKEGEKYDYIRSHNVLKYHNISFELWKEVTKACIICGFDKCVELHHLDRNHGNNSRENFIGLCPNHHKMLHNQLYSAETEVVVREKLRLRAQADGNYLQYCNKGEKIADESMEKRYGSMRVNPRLATCEISKDLGWSSGKTTCLVQKLDLDGILLNMPVK